MKTDQDAAGHNRGKPTANPINDSFDRSLAKFATSAKHVSAHNYFYREVERRVSPLASVVRSTTRVSCDENRIRDSRIR